jgi:hypothetical protein
LFISILSAASCGHPLQESVEPRGDVTWRLRVFIALRMLVLVCRTVHRIDAGAVRLAI